MFSKTIGRYYKSLFERRNVGTHNHDMVQKILEPAIIGIFVLSGGEPPPFDTNRNQ